MDLRPNKKTKGSTLVEGTIVALVLSTLIGGVLLVLYLSFTRVWVKGALYDGLICVQEERPQSECRRIVQNRLSYLPWGTTSGLKLADSGDGSVWIEIQERLRLNVEQFLPEKLK
jgi:hypothetical protein